VTETQLVQNELSNLEAEGKSMRAMLNGMLDRDPDAALELARTLPSPRPVLADDARLIALAVDQNPELAALARQVAGRKDAIELAKLAYLPDINPSAGVTGSLSQFLAAMVMLPTTLPAIRAVIADAQAMERSAEAMSRQTRQHYPQAFARGMVTRTVHHQVPPRVDHRLTNWGRVLCPALDAILKWAECRDDFQTTPPLRRSAPA
jgi:outer membrane protein, heavy metal efflux system